jgi:hypothetical protein
MRLLAIVAIVRGAGMIFILIAAVFMPIIAVVAVVVIAVVVIYVVAVIVVCVVAVIVVTVTCQGKPQLTWLDRTNQASGRPCPLLNRSRL